MKKVLLLCVFCCSTSLFGQSKTEILPLMKSLIKYSLANDYEKVMDLTYPKLFELVAREDMMAVIAQVMNNDNVRMEVLEIDNAIEIGDVHNIDGGKYVVVQYDNAFEMQMKDMTYIDPEQYKSLIQAGMDGSDVTYDSDDQVFTVKMRAKNIAISDVYTDGKWRFLNANKSDYTMLESLIDPKILKQLDL